MHAHSVVLGRNDDVLFGSFAYGDQIPSVPLGIVILKSRCKVEHVPAHRTFATVEEMLLFSLFFAADTFVPVRRVAARPLLRKGVLVRDRLELFIPAYRTGVLYDAAVDMGGRLCDDAFVPDMPALFDAYPAARTDLPVSLIVLFPCAARIVTQCGHAFAVRIITDAAIVV